MITTQNDILPSYSIIFTEIDVTLLNVVIMVQDLHVVMEGASMLQKTYIVERIVVLPGEHAVIITLHYYIVT